MISRLRSLLTPQVLLLLLALVLFGALWGAGSADSGQTSLEARAAKVLSDVQGAGEVSVVISMRSTGGRSSTLSLSETAQEQVPSGAVAVAQGADDPFVCAQLTQALCALLGLPPSAVSVIPGGK